MTFPFVFTPFSNVEVVVQTPEPRPRRVRSLPTFPVPYSTSCRVFYGTWPDKNGRGLTELLVEQVSHHPPITAYLIENKTKGITLIGHNAQKTSFSC
jgi:hypothetical protein